MDAFTPAQATELMSRIGAKKTKQRLDKLFINSVLAGALLAFGAALALSTETAPWFQTNAPGLIKTIGAFFFPVGLVMIVLTGADLLTSNMMFMFVALIHRRATIVDLLINWTVTFLGNLAGALFYMAILVGYAGTFDVPVYREQAIAFATTKIVTPGWHQVFLRGIGCNWLVCMAVFLSLEAREIISKIAAIWLPIMTFVALGYDHVVANMFFIPLAIFLKAPKITVGYYIWKSMIPSAIGNIVGAVLFISLPYFYLYLTGNGDVKIHFDLDPSSTATDTLGGPMGPSARHGNNASFTMGKEESDGSVSPADQHQLPDSRSNAKSGIADELHASNFVKTKTETSTA